MRSRKSAVLSVGVALLAFSSIGAVPGNARSQVQITTHADDAPNIYTTSAGYDAWFEDAAFGGPLFTPSTVHGYDSFIATGGTLGAATSYGKRLHWVTLIHAKKGGINIADGVSYTFRVTYEQNEVTWEGDRYPFYPDFDNSFSEYHTLGNGNHGVAGIRDGQLVTDPNDDGDVDRLVLAVPGIAYAAYTQADWDNAYGWLAQYGVVHLELCVSYADGKPVCDKVVVNPAH